MTKFIQKYCGIQFAVAIALILASPVFAQIDFSEMSDVEVEMHPDRRAAGEESLRRTANYTREDFEALSREVSRIRDTPGAQRVWTVAEYFDMINHSANYGFCHRTMNKINARFEEGDGSEKAAIREAFLEGWAAVPFLVNDEDSYNRGRHILYMRNARNYVVSEEEFLPMLKEKFLSDDLLTGQTYFLDALDIVGIPLGEATALEVEKIYYALKESPNGGIFRPRESVPSADNSKIHRVLGRCGRPGLDVIERLGTSDTDAGIWALTISRIPETEDLLWEKFEAAPENHDRQRIRLLNCLNHLTGDEATRKVRRDRIREAFLPYLKLPEGEIDLWALGHAIDFAIDSKDPYYLEHVTALENAVRTLGPDENLTGGDATADLNTRLATFYEGAEKAREKLEAVEASE